MKRVVCCALCIVFLIATVSAITPVVQKTLIPATLVTQQVLVHPSSLVSIQPSATPTELLPPSMMIKSNPPGAEIWIFGNKSGDVTPMYYPQLLYLASYYPITLKYPGYEPYFTTVSPRPGDAVVIDATLVPLPPTTQPVTSQAPSSQTDSLPTNTQAPVQQAQGQTIGSGSAVSSPETTGSLSITTTPAGAAVSVDNEVKGISPAMISGLSPGSHTIKITKEGYQDFSTTISIEAGKVREYSTGLAAETITVTASDTTAAKSPGFAVVAAIVAVFCLTLFRKISQ